MPRFAKSHPVRHSARAMFDLVADVERYPEFVPLCETLKIRSRRERAGREILVAEMGIAYRGIRQNFTTRVILDLPGLAIDVFYVDGPFEHLENHWRFRPGGDAACTIEFEIDYRFRSKALGLVMGAVFDRAFRRFTTAFEERADRIYA